jgi:TatD DNase family protein
MASDVHAHPLDLLNLAGEAETERRSLSIACAASSCTKDEFLFIEKAAAEAKKDQAAPLFPCFAIHPQFPAFILKENPSCSSADFKESLDLLSMLAAEGRISAVGECGFDLYSPAYKETETIQDELFPAQLEIATQYNLPLILHIRRAMHKIFPYSKILKKLPAVIFHSWPGSPDEAFSLLRKGINAYFSFGTTLLLNHKNAIQSFASIPSMNLLLETDAPYQPMRGKLYSSWADIPAILEAAAKIRKEANAASETAELEQIIDRNFFGIFNHLPG